MTVEKDPNTGKWLIQYRYKDWTGKSHKSTKRGFRTKKEAEEWYRSFLLKQNRSLDMKFSDFTALYMEDMRHRLREHTIIQKEYVLPDKLIPYFGEKKMNEITVADIRAWQNAMIKEGYQPTYLKHIHNQLSAIFNYAVNYYDLGSNPCKKACSMGKSKADEMQFWTKEEFEKFSDCLMDKRLSWLSFQILFWTGIRIGELLALTFEDVDMESEAFERDYLEQEVINQMDDYAEDIAEDGREITGTEIIDFKYKQNTIKKPIEIKIEVLEFYPGILSNDVYISDIRCGFGKSISSGR